MNRLIEEQNELKYLRLLNAQRIAYSNAKRLLFFDIISILIAFSPTFLLALDLNLANIIAVIGVFWTIISIFSQVFIERQTRTGAVIQDEFDTMLFGLKWNHVLVGEKIETSSILALSKKYRKDDMKDWYSLEIPKNIEKEAAVLLAYKCNAIWGIDQRKKYIIFIKTMIIIYYGGMMGLSIYKNIGLYDMSMWLAPSIPALVFGISTIKLQNGIIEACLKINKVVDQLFDEYKTTAKIPTKVELRQIQDLFFTQRLIPNKVPDWFYAIFKSHHSKIADETIKIMVNE
jgi:hypothetical protein